MTPADRGGDIVIGGGGSFAVATGDLFSRARRLEQLDSELRSCATALARIDRIVQDSLLVSADAPLSAARAEAAIDEASAHLDAAATSSGLLAAALRASADAYGLGDQAVAGLTQSIAAQLGIGAGFLSSVIGWVALPTAAAALLGGAAGFALSSAVDPVGTRQRVAGARKWLMGQKGVLSDPRFVELARLSVMSADDFGAGVLRVPLPVARLLGDEGLGVVGLDTTAAAAIAVGGLAGALRETPVIVSARPTILGAPSVTFADRASRIPEGGGQVRVDRYVRKGSDRFEVFIGGTADGSVFAGTEPWDMTSNVTAVADRSAGSYRAVVQALAAAGVDASSEIVITGYSQGGLVGSRIAGSGDYNVTGLFTLGAPAGQVAVPSEIPWVAVEHTDDLIPALGGTWTASDPVLVSREALAAGAANGGEATGEGTTGRAATGEGTNGGGATGGGANGADTELVFPAHQLSRYLDTAAMVDSSGEERIVAANVRFNEGSEAVIRVESTLFEARRAGPPG